MQPRRPATPSDDWLLEQQVRAEMEAVAWRRLREIRKREALEAAQAFQPVAEAQPPRAAPVPATPAPATSAPPRPAPAPFNPHRTGSAILKGLVRFVLAAFGAYLVYVAGEDSRLGEFEVWLATGSAFPVILALSLIEPLRGAVHSLAEGMRWALIAGAAAGCAWVFTHLGS